jgi:3-oxoacyl-[acyl-carrier-protein] synthase-3
MDGREIFDFALREVPKDIWRCLELNGLRVEEIDAVVLHQANAFMVKSIARRLKLPDDRVVLEIRDVGNTTSSSIPIALARRILNRPDLPRHVLLSGFGVGLSWGSTILTASGGADHDG